MRLNATPAATHPSTREAPPRLSPSRDLTTGPIGLTLLRFALPTLASSVLQSMNGSINTAWIGHLLGVTAVAATSNANVIVFVMQAFVFGFGMAATIFVGQSVGRRDMDEARRAFAAALSVVVCLSVLVTSVGWFSSPQLLRSLHTPASSAPLALTYLRVILLAMPASFLLVLLMMSLRGAGDAVTPLWFMGLSVVLDCGLNPLLIHGVGPLPALEIAGSALATAIASYGSLIALVAYIYGRDLPLRLRAAELHYLRPEAKLLRSILAKGLPIGLQIIVVSTAALAMMGLANDEGLATSAAFGVTTQLWTYVQMPAMAIGAAVSAMAAQSIGAGRWDRIGRVTRSGLLLNLVLTGALVTLVLLLGPFLIRLLLGSSEPAASIAEHISLLATWGFILFGMTMVLFGVVRANGAVIAPLLILVVAMFPVRIGAAVGLHSWLGADALWWSFPLGSMASLTLATLYYRLGGWRRTEP